MTPPDINFYAIIDETASMSPPKKKIYYTNPNVAIVFGSFTQKECSEAQGVPEPTSTSTIGTQTSSDLLSNFPVPPALYFRQPIPCTRCGHLGHNIEKCVARRNIHGEFIKQSPTSPNKFKIYPQSPPTSPSRGGDTHYYNTHLIQNGWCNSDKTDYTQFVFTQDEVDDWIEEQHELFVPPPRPVSAEPAQVVYVPFLIRNQTRYAPVMIPSADQEVDYILRYNYAMTDYMLGRQAAAYAY